MEFALKKWLILLSAILWIIRIDGMKSCIEGERLGLLEFKAYVGSVGYDADHLLPSWVDDDPNSNCCQWERVACNSATGHVIELSLDNTLQLDLDSLYAGENIWFLNISMLQQFKELRSLNLSYNDIGGLIEEEGFKILSSLKKLEVLDLSRNRFNSSIFSSLAALTSLKSLILSSNAMEGSFPNQELSALKNLEMLDVSYNEFNSCLPIRDFTSLSKMSKLKYLDLSENFFTILSALEILDMSFNSYLSGPPFVQEVAKFHNLRVLKLRACKLNGPLSTLNLSTFKNLEILDLGENAFSGSVPGCMWAPPSLKALSLYQNFLNGFLPKQSFCELKNLKELDLSHNEFQGGLPPCFQNLTSLEFLDLSDNGFSGHIPSDMLANLKSLNYFDISSNIFDGLFSFYTFANHSNLKGVIFSNNKLKVATQYPNWVPPFQLEVLVLQKCSLESIPEFLFHQFKLEVVDLSHNKIQAPFPSWLLENNSGLYYLSLMNNSFSGAIGATIFPNMMTLNLAMNHLEGNFPFSPGGECNFLSLDLSSNNFSGELPEKFLSSCFSLKSLKLSHNNFHGQVFKSQFNLTFLLSLELNNNQFLGTLPSLRKFDFMKLLDLSNNGFHDEIPRWMDNITDLNYVDFSHNLFNGQISCRLLSAAYVDLSHNLFCGPLPICLNLDSFGSMNNPLHINLQGNKFIGSLPGSLLNLSSLLTLNLRDNRLSGNIPNTFGGCPHLRLLLLGGNRLNGQIPIGLCKQNNLSLLDLSDNSFSGSIPHCLYNLSFGTKGLHDDFKSENLYEIFWLGGYVGRLITIEMIVAEFGIIVHIEEAIEFITKDRTNIYKGDILNYMTGLDLSRNNLTGEIPNELGLLSQIHALNLSHNQLIGSIPTSFSNLTQLESLDLSHNKLSGEIPSELIALHFLEVFSVAYNDFSGKIPDMKGQFSTFDNNSFEGNPLLCGPQVEKRCSGDEESTLSTTTWPNDEDGKWYEVDHLVFFASFVGSFMMFFLGIIIFLYVNPYWQNKLFYHIEEFMFSFYYLLYDHLFNYFVRLCH